MIDGLIAGKLYGAPQERTSKAGKPFVVAKVRCAAGDGESLFVNVIAFDGDVCIALLALGDGDSVAMWIDREGVARPALDIVAAQVLTAYHVTRKRRVMDPQPPEDNFPTDRWEGCT